MEKEIVTIVRVTAGRHWHALDDDEVVGRGHALHRRDGRAFLSIDTWRDDVFHELAAAMLTDLPAPVYTVVDQDDREVTARWRAAGFVEHRRERELVVPTDPADTGLETVGPPFGVTIVPVGRALEGPLSQLDQVLREQVGTEWRSMPAEVLARPGAGGVVDPSRYVVASLDDQYIGLVRVAPLPRRPRLGLVAVHAAHRRRGVARAMLAEVLGSLHRVGIDSLSTEVDEQNAAATALFRGVGAWPSGGVVELVRR